HPAEGRLAQEAQALVFRDGLEALVVGRHHRLMVQLTDVLGQGQRSHSHLPATLSRAEWPSPAGLAERMATGRSSGHAASGAPTRAASSRSSPARLPGTTTTGQGARAAHCWLTEPRSRPAEPVAIS